MIYVKFFLFLFFIVIVASFITYICRRDMVDDKIDYASVELVATVIDLNRKITFPPRGTVLAAFCFNDDRFHRYADGRGGTYEMLAKIYDGECVELNANTPPDKAVYHNLVSGCLKMIPLLRT